MQMTGAEKAKNLKIAYIGGGSRGWAWGFMKDLAMDGDMCGTIRLYDIEEGLLDDILRRPGVDPGRSHQT